MNAHVLSLFVRENRELSSETLEVKSGNLLIEFLRKFIHSVFIFSLFSVGPKFDLGKGLVGERT